MVKNVKCIIRCLKRVGAPKAAIRKWSNYNNGGILGEASPCDCSNKSASASDCEGGWLGLVDPKDPTSDLMRCSWDGGACSPSSDPLGTESCAES